MKKLSKCWNRATRNKEIFEEIARTLMQFGIDKRLETMSYQIQKF